MKTTYLHLLGLLCILLMSISSAHAQDDLIASAKSAIKTGDAQGLSSHFNNPVELNLNQIKNSYDKGQATQKLGEFFSKYPATDFRYIHQGASKQGMKYAIGKYTHSQGSFRVYMLVKEADGKYIIDTLDFGEE